MQRLDRMNPNFGPNFTLFYVIFPIDIVSSARLDDVLARSLTTWTLPTPGE